NRNRPNVSSVSGSVSTIITGRTNAFTSPSTMAPSKAEPKPATCTPPTNWATTSSAAAVSTRWRTKPFMQARRSRHRIQDDDQERRDGPEQQGHEPPGEAAPALALREPGVDQRQGAPADRILTGILPFHPQPPPVLPRCRWRRTAQPAARTRRYSARSSSLKQQNVTRVMEGVSGSVRRTVSTAIGAASSLGKP